jgi:hypothetical protein
MKISLIALCALALLPLPSWAWVSSETSGPAALTGSEWNVGPGGKLELVSSEGTVVRAGAQTLLTLDSENALSFKSGRMLIHSPAGQGTFRLRVGDGILTFQNATLGVSLTGNPQTLSIAILDGKALFTPNGQKDTLLSSGQLLKVSLPIKNAPALTSFDVARLVQTSKLLNGFSTRFAGQNRIDRAVAQFQNHAERGFVVAAGSGPSQVPGGVDKPLFVDGVQVVSNFSSRGATPSIVTVGSSGAGSIVSSGGGSFGAVTVSSEVSTITHANELSGAGITAFNITFSGSVLSTSEIGGLILAPGSVISGGTTIALPSGGVLTVAPGSTIIGATPTP